MHLDPPEHLFKPRPRVLIVGAGLSGAVLARSLAEYKIASLVIDRREHIAGMCYSSVDEETGVEVHRFGPHIFHTNSERVWEFVNRFATWYPYVNKIMAVNARGVFSMPINLLTINNLFGKRFTPPEARAFIETLQEKSITTPRNAEEQLLRFVGREIYETFFRDYTVKQWGVSPRELPADIIKRLPVRMDYNDNYYTDKYQGFPMEGYTGLVQRMLDHPDIELKLNAAYDPAMAAEFEHVFYAGPLDEYFAYSEGELSYRTLDFRYERGTGVQQGSGCLNYTDMSVPFTRGHEHCYFSPWQPVEKSVVVYEYSREAGRNDDRFYPKRMAADTERLQRYVALAQQVQGHTTFIGRLGCYRYLDMQHVILQALECADAWARHKHGLAAEAPLFSVSPL